MKNILLTFIIFLSLLNAKDTLYVQQQNVLYVQNLIEIEEKNYQVNHATIGYYVASSWRLPKDVCQIILQHHERDYLDIIDGSQEQDLFSILKLAEHIVSLKLLDVPSPDWPYFEEAVLSILAIKKEDLNDIIAQISESL